MGFNILNLCNPEPEEEPAIEAGQSAHVRGRQGLFFVINVDLESRTADLISAHGISPMLRDIPFSSMQPSAVALTYPESSSPAC